MNAASRQPGRVRSSDSPSISSGGAAPSTALATGSRGDREVFTTDELAIVLSHYDVGVIDSIQQFPRGSRRAPKLIVHCDRGTYMLKRRAIGRDDPFKVAFSHQIQLYLATKQFPIAHLIGTRQDNNSMLQWNGSIYELFDYVKGTSYDNSLEATTEAGRMLALFHKLLREYQPEYDPSIGSYHAARVVVQSMDAIPRRLAEVDPHHEQVADLLAFLHTSYDEAALRVNELGLSDWPHQIVHCDWHPGNMLFHGARVVAVIDYDSSRIQQKIIDIANGALQFSIIGGGNDPVQWPEYLDLSRYKRFILTYESVPDCVLSKAEVQSVPWLMIEALIAESAIPVANTGSFARMEGAGFLRMVERKVRWLQQHASELVEKLEG